MVGITERSPHQKSKLKPNFSIKTLSDQNKNTTIYLVGLRVTVKNHQGKMEVTYEVDVTPSSQPLYSTSVKNKFTYPGNSNPDDIFRFYPQLSLLNAFETTHLPAVHKSIRNMATMHIYLVKPTANRLAPVVKCRSVIYGNIDCHLFLLFNNLLQIL